MFAVIDPTILDISADEVDHYWAGPPYAESLYCAGLELVAELPAFVAGVQQTVDVRVTNLGASTWRWQIGCASGNPARLPLVERLSDADPENAALRTALPADVPPGTAVVPVHVVAPAGAGH